MDNHLLELIHRYAEDREIDYISAKVIGEQYGMEFHNEEDLQEWKKIIDKYLGTFYQGDFNAIEEACKKSKKKKKKMNEEELDMDMIPGASDEEGDMDMDEMLEMNGFWDWFEKTKDPKNGAQKIWDYADKGIKTQDLIDGIQHHAYVMQMNVSQEIDDDLIEETNEYIELLKKLASNIKSTKNESRNLKEEKNEEKFKKYLRMEPGMKQAKYSMKAFGKDLEPIIKKYLRMEPGMNKAKYSMRELGFDLEPYEDKIKKSTKNESRKRNSESLL